MQMGFYFDQTRCTGCYACMIACKDWHDIPAGPANWMRVLYSEEGKFPKIYVSHLATPCYHCAEPICSFVCPVDEPPLITYKYVKGKKDIYPETPKKKAPPVLR